MWEYELVKSKKRFWTKNEKTYGNNQHWINISTKQYKTREIYIYIYITVCLYIYICSHRISPCCSPCWWVFLRFSISSPGDFISFPHLFDHFINGFDQVSKPIWSVYHKKKCFPPISSFCCLVSSAVPSFPNLFLQLIITVCLQFSKVFPTYWCMLSLGFISFSHLFLVLIMMFHEFWLSVPSLYH